MSHAEHPGGHFGGGDRAGAGGGGGGYDAGGFRSKPKRPVVDYGSTVVRWNWERKQRQGSERERPSPSYIIDMDPPVGRVTEPGSTIPAKHLHSSLNKIKHPINVVKWTPEGRRLLTGSSSGEFTLWNGMAFNFETIMSAHDSAVRAAIWSGSDDWLLSADQDGIVKYWQPNFNNVKELEAHPRSAIRDIAFAPTDTKFATASDDGTLKIWNFATAAEERELKGHGWDVKTCDWHPERGLIVSGSKDHTIKLWDPRTANCLTTLHGHKTTISKVRFGGRNGMCMATCARDNTARIFDLKMMRDALLLRGHDRDITTVCWHPIHPHLVSTGSNDGSICHYVLDNPSTAEGQPKSISPYDHKEPEKAPPQVINAAHKIQFAHESAVWSLDWHPLGHILASGSNDRATRFWTRPRPGDNTWPSDHWHKGPDATTATSWRLGGPPTKRGTTHEDGQDEDEGEALVDQKMPTPASSGPPGLPGLPGLGASAPSGFPGASAPPSEAVQRAESLLGLGMPYPPPPPPGMMPGGQPLPFPFPPPGQAGQIPPPPIPGMGGIPPPPPPGFPFHQPPPPPGAQGMPGLGGPPPGQLPGMGGFPGAPPPPQGYLGIPGFPVQGQGQGQTPTQDGGAGSRKRSPLPPQKESFRQNR